MPNCRTRASQECTPTQLRLDERDAEFQHERSHTPTMHESRQNFRRRVLYWSLSSGTILNESRSRHLPGVRLCFLFFLLLVAAASQGCVAGPALVRRDTAEVAHKAPSVAWFGPADASERSILS